MKKKVRNLSFLLFVVLIMALSIWGPEFKPLRPQFLSKSAIEAFA